LQGSLEHLFAYHTLSSDTLLLQSTYQSLVNWVDNL
jgi:hypothetical protein